MRGLTEREIVHAGLMFDSSHIIEALGTGIAASHLRVQNIGCRYRVYRARNLNMARGAGTCARMMLDIQAAHNTMQYSLSGAVGTAWGSGTARSAENMHALLNDVLKGKGRPFFCSQFVVFTYQFVAQQMGMRPSQVFEDADAKVSPAKLANVLAHSNAFSNVGDVEANIRQQIRASWHNEAWRPKYVTVFVHWTVPTAAVS
jgi:hypothetical protein